MPLGRAMIVSMVCGSILWSPPAEAEWKAAGPDVTAAAQNPKIAGALAAINKLDRAVIEDDHATFASLIADDLVVNNPQNRLSLPGATVELNAKGRISYSQYDRTVEYTGMRGEMVLVMGEELCVPKPPNPAAGQLIRRRFTDVWKFENGGWRLTARQATIIPPASK